MYENMDSYELRALELENELVERRAAAKDKEAFDREPFEIDQFAIIARYRRISKTWFRPSALRK